MGAKIIKDSSIMQSGFKIIKFEGNKNLLDLAIAKNWVGLDQEFSKLITCNGFFHSLFLEYLNFNNVEFIINNRMAESDEDGIWHDDGSRLLAFSLSLNSDIRTIEGGQLQIRHKTKPELVNSLGPFNFGTLALFLTGKFGFDHKVCRVIKGERTTIAGWLS